LYDSDKFKDSNLITLKTLTKNATTDLKTLAIRYAKKLKYDDHCPLYYSCYPNENYIIFLNQYLESLLIYVRNTDIFIFAEICSTQIKKYLSSFNYFEQDYPISYSVVSSIIKYNLFNFIIENKDKYLDIREIFENFFEKNFRDAYVKKLANLFLKNSKNVMIPENIIAKHFLPIWQNVFTEEVINYYTIFMTKIIELLNNFIYGSAKNFLTCSTKYIVKPFENYYSENNLKIINDNTHYSISNMSSSILNNNFSHFMQISKIEIENDVLIIINVHVRDITKMESLDKTLTNAIKNIIENGYYNIIIIGDFNKKGFIGLDDALNTKKYEIYRDDNKLLKFKMYDLSSIYENYNECVNKKKHEYIKLFYMLKNYKKPLCGKLDCLFNVNTSSHVPLKIKLIRR